MARDERWHPASEVPECERGKDIRIIIEDDMGETHEGIYSNSKEVAAVHSTGFHVRPERWHRIAMRAVRWRYWPEPPTPEEEARRELGDVLADLSPTLVKGGSDVSLWFDSHDDAMRAYDAIEAAVAKGRTSSR